MDSSIDSGFYTIPVDRTGIEIDAGYETNESLVLIEAKNVIADDFLVRQLYYPYRLWKEKVKKNVRTIFMQYHNGIFSLYEYKFKEPDRYNSLELMKSKRYSIVSPEEMKITEQDILDIIKSIKIADEPEVPFPQANSFDRVINLLEMLNTDTIKTKEEITVEFEFDPRQTDYYFNAGKYLGFLEESKIVIEENKKNVEMTAIALTSRGKNLFNTSHKNRQLEYIKAILEHQVFYDVFNEYKENNITKDKLIQIMKKSNLYNLKSDVTIERRASTIQRWIEWIINITNYQKM